MSDNPSNPETSILPPSLGVSQGETVDPQQGIFRRRVLTFIGIGTFVVVLLLTGWVTVNILMLVFFSALIAIIIRSLMRVITSRTQLGEKVAFGIVLVGLVVSIGLLIALLGPQITAQIDELSTQLPQSAEQLQTELGRTQWGQFLLDQLPSEAELDEMVSSDQGNLFANIAGAFSRTFGWLTNAVVVIFIAIYMAFEPHVYINNFIRLFPFDGRKRVREVLNSVGKILEQWLVSRFLSMTFVGIATTIGLLVLGVPLALTLGIITGLLSFIPTFGPVFSVIPSALLALLQSPQLAISVIVLYIAVQQVDNYLVTPFLERKTVALAPVLTITVQLLLGVLVGFFGLVLAAPITAAVMTLVRMLYIEDVLHDYSSEKSDSA